VTGDKRAQAFTLEGFVGAVVILTAVLFAVQATAGTANLGGTMDEGTRAELRTDAQTVLAARANSDAVDSETGERRDLAFVVRYWDAPEYRYYGATDRVTGYGSDGPPAELFDGNLDDLFLDRGYSYNLVVEYRGGNTSNVSDGTGTERLVWMGPPGEDAVVVGRTVTLFDNQTLTEPTASNRQLWEYENDPRGANYYPIPDAAPSSAVYNVVRVRLVVW
jgi:hypothetical protein